MSEHDAVRWRMDGAAGREGTAAGRDDERLNAAALEARFRAAGLTKGDDGQWRDRSGRIIHHPGLVLPVAAGSGESTRGSGSTG